MDKIFYVLWAIGVGIIGAIHLPMNSQVSERVGSALAASLSFFGVALITSLIAFLILRPASELRNFTNVPPYLFLAGVISGVLVFSLTSLIPQLGTAMMFVILVSVQGVVSALISHFGWFETPQSPLTLIRAGGIALTLAGAYIARSPAA